MKGKKRAYKAIDGMTARAVHTKEVAKYIIKHNNFTCKEVVEKTGAPQHGINRIIERLEEVYLFEFERTYRGRFIQFELINCKYEGERNKIDKPLPVQRPKPEPLRKPLFINPLWALCLAMQI